MQDLIASYLFKNKKCPLPTVGSLSVVESHAVADYGEISIIPPVPSIQFSSKAEPASDFIHFIADQKKTTNEEALNAVKEFCFKLSRLDVHTEVPIASAGKFYINSSGSLQFKQTHLPGSFFPSVNAERVVHPNDSHKMLVGDTHTTTSIMTDFFNEEEISIRNRWWLWAILLFIIAACLIMFYLNDQNSNELFGVAH